MVQVIYNSTLPSTITFTYPPTTTTTTNHPLLSSLSPAEFLFGDAKSYTFMSNGYVAVPGINDANEYEDTVEAMNIMGMPEEEQSGEYLYNNPPPVRPLVDCRRVWRNFMMDTHNSHVTSSGAFDLQTFETASLCVNWFFHHFLLSLSLSL